WMNPHYTTNHRPPILQTCWYPLMSVTMRAVILVITIHANESLLPGHMSLIPWMLLLHSRVPILSPVVITS
ncbi:hypothetical protein Moror_5933, partial [Moniliophthora roreri MCA 2997]